MLDLFTSPNHKEVPVSQFQIVTNINQAIACRTLWNLQQLGIKGLNSLEMPKRSTQVLIEKNYPEAKHQCVADYEELFRDGIPVFKELIIPFWGSIKGTCVMDTLNGDAYWSDPVLLLHEGRSPERKEWHPLGLVQAACLLGQYPHLGAVRFEMPSSTSWEVFIAPDKHMYVWEGETHHEHHMAYTQQKSPKHLWRYTN